MRNRGISVDMSHTGLELIDQVLNPRHVATNHGVLEELGLTLVEQSVLPGDQFLSLMAAVDQAFLGGDGDGFSALMELV